MNAAVPFVAWMLDAAAALVAPSRCAACDARVAMRAVFCRPCAHTVETLPPDADENALAPFAYGGAVARAIASFKYAQRPDLARPLAHLLRRGVAPLLADPPAIVVPVPLHPLRLAARGYNQAALLASPIARDLGARFAPRALVRTRDTTAQASLDRDARITNVADAFVAHARWKGDAADVLVVDDVRTTGATLDACVHALRKAGATRVRTLVIARVERP